MFKNYISKKCNTKKRQTILGSKNLIWLRPIYDSMLTQSLPLYRKFLWNLLSPPTTRLIPDTVSVDSLSKPKHCKSDCAGLQIRRQLVNGCWTVGFLRLNASASEGIGSLGFGWVGGGTVRNLPLYQPVSQRPSHWKPHSTCVKRMSCTADERKWTWMHKPPDFIFVCIFARTLPSPEVIVW